MPVAKKRAPKKYEVTLETPMTLPGRTKQDRITLTYQVYAFSSKQATKAVKDAGHKGKLISVTVS